MSRIVRGRHIVPCEIRVVFSMRKFSSPSMVHFPRIFLSTLKRESAFLHLPSCHFLSSSLQHSHKYLISFNPLRCGGHVAVSLFQTAFLKLYVSRFSKLSWHDGPRSAWFVVTIMRNVENFFSLNILITHR